MAHTKEYKDFLKDVILLLKANILDLREKRISADDHEKDYIAARLFSYHEIITSIRGQIKEYNILPNEIGLDELENII